MTADIIQIRDWQSKRDLERMNAELEKQAMEIANIAFPSVLEAHYPEIPHYHAIDQAQHEAVSRGEWAKALQLQDAKAAYTAPEKDPA